MDCWSEETLRKRHKVEKIENTENIENTEKSKENKAFYRTKVKQTQER